MSLMRPRGFADFEQLSQGKASGGKLVWSGTFGTGLLLLLVIFFQDTTV